MCFLPDEGRARSAGTAVCLSARDQSSLAPVLGSAVINSDPESKLTPYFISPHLHPKQPSPLHRSPILSLLLLHFLKVCAWKPELVRPALGFRNFSCYLLPP